jgi:hypothetical protein
MNVLTKTTLKKFVPFQIVLFSALVINYILNIWVQLSYQNFAVQAILNQINPFCFYILHAYLPLAILLFIIQYILSKFRHPFLYFYYYIWINKIFYCIYKCDRTKKGILNQVASFLMEMWFNEVGKNPNRDDLILDSFPHNIKKNLPDTKDYSTYVQYIALENRPVVVRREDLLEKTFLKKWAFVSVLFFKPIYISKLTSSEARLIIDLRNESYGIYNNAGKLFLKMHYLKNKKVASSLVSGSLGLESFIQSDKTGERKFDFHIPFRWASGGIMPIAQYKEKEWFVLFLRELDPVGLNIANGASENKDEYKNIIKLMYREFGEELILLDHEPMEDSEVGQKPFQYPYEQEDGKDPLIRNEEFASEHQKMRRLHDGINIKFSKDGPAIERIKTPFEVEITYHDENLNDTKNQIKKNIIFNINPTEFGIEISYVAKFKMDDDDYLLDGEIWNDDFLVRQPILLISCEFIKKLYAKNKSIGVPGVSDDCNDCRVIDRIPHGEYVLFNADLNFRKRRLQKLEACGSGESLEAQKIRRWLDRHERMFANIDPQITDLNSEEHPYLTRLCPVTWKTFEKLCHYNLI